MDVRYINPFIRSIEQVFIEMVNIPVKIGSPYLKTIHERIHKLFQVSAIIELKGSASGKVVVSLSEPVGLAIASALLNTQIKSINDDCRDAIGELTNMIVGSAKKDIPSDRPITVTVPKVVASEDVTYPSDLPVLIIPIDTSAGRLILQVALLCRKHA